MHELSDLIIKLPTLAARDSAETYRAKAKPILSALEKEQLATGYLGFIASRCEFQVGMDLHILLMIALLPDDVIALNTIIDRLRTLLIFHNEGLLSQQIAVISTAANYKLISIAPGYVEKGDPVVINTAKDILRENNITADKQLSKKNVESIAQQKLGTDNTKNTIPDSLDLNQLFIDNLKIVLKRSNVLFDNTANDNDIEIIAEKNINKICKENLSYEDFKSGMVERIKTRLNNADLQYQIDGIVQRVEEEQLIMRFLQRYNDANERLFFNSIYPATYPVFISVNQLSIYIENQISIGNHVELNTKKLKALREINASNDIESYKNNFKKHLPLLNTKADSFISQVLHAIGKILHISSLQNETTNLTNSVIQTAKQRLFHNEDKNNFRKREQYNNKNRPRF
jgi:hypothetical protein